MVDKPKESSTQPPQKKRKIDFATRQGLTTEHSTPDQTQQASTSRTDASQRPYQTLKRGNHTIITNDLITQVTAEAAGYEIQKTRLK